MLEPKAGNRPGRPKPKGATLTDFLKNTVLRPGLERLGSVTATWLITLGATSETANMVTVGAIAGALFAVDLVLIQLRRKGVLNGKL